MQWCNNHLPDHKVISHGNNDLHVVFDSYSGFETGGGFEIEYQALPEDEIQDCADDEFICGNPLNAEPVCRPKSDICNGEVNCFGGIDEDDCDLKCGGSIAIDNSNKNSIAGTLISPGYEDGLYVRSHCRWSITDLDYVPGKTAIYFITHEVSMFSSSECYDDYLMFSDSNYQYNTTMCNNIIQPNVKIDQTDKAYIAFNTNDNKPLDNHVYRGFNVSFVKIDINEPNCDAEHGKFQCLNGRCIDQSQVCNGKNDCFDYSDELYCQGKPKCGQQAVQPVFDMSIYPSDGSDPAVGIVGGEVAVEYSWPWQGYMTKGNSGELCGGTLIAPQYMITAAHCFSKVIAYTWNKYNWILGRPTTNKKVPSTEQDKHVDSIWWHPWFNKYSRDYDYALVKFRRPVTYTDYVSPICFPDQPFNLGPDVNTVVTGFGDTQFSGGSGKLKQVVVPTWANDVCEDALEDYSSKKDQITDRMVCAGYAAGGHDACQGDSGGPQVWFNNQTQAWELYGIVSWGWSCAKPNLPGVYSRFAHPEGMDWAKSVMLKNGWRGE